MRQPGRIVPLFVVLAVLLCGCNSGPGPKGEHPQKKVDLVDCNYFWPTRNRHVCIKDMPKEECEELFYASGFQRDRGCFCDGQGREKNQVRGTGYVQYDCQ